MARITIITHNHLRDAGQAPQALEAAGASVTQWDMQEKGRAPNYTSYDALVVLGGPMRIEETDDHPWLRDELAAIESCLEDNKPILGVCLGAQMICALAGGRVEEAARPERQYNYMRVVRDDELTVGLPEIMPLYNAHSDTMILPEGATEFIAGGWCPQGVRFGPAAWGLQFHPEATEELVQYWHSRVEDLLIAIGTSKEKQDRHYLAHGQENSELGRRIFKNFVDIIQGND